MTSLQTVEGHRNITASADTKFVSEGALTFGDSSSHPFAALPPDDMKKFNDQAFYITLTHNRSDIIAIADLAKSKKFLFAPFNEDIRNNVNPMAAAARLVFGNTRNLFTLVVRATDTDRFMGCVRFEKLERRQAEISYFFSPENYWRGLGTKSVLRSVHWLTQENHGIGELTNLRRLIATVDASENAPSVKILRKIGMTKPTAWLLPEESGYKDQKGNLRPRLTMAARIPTETGPALAAALTRGDYSLKTEMRLSL